MSAAPVLPRAPSDVSDARAVLAATLASGAMMAQVTAGKATRDTLFLSTFGAAGLPSVMTASAIVAIVGVTASGRLLVRHSPARVVPTAFHVSAMAFVAEWLLLGAWPSAIAFSVYVHIVAFGAVLSSGFWSVVAERFDPHAAKRSVSRIAIGGTIGGLVGGLIGWWLASNASVGAVLLLLAALSVAAGVGIGWFGAASSGALSSLEPGPHPASIGKLLRDTPYLRNVAVVVLLGALVQALLDYTLGLQARLTFGRGAGLMTFFSLFYAAAGVVTTAVQLTVGGRLLERRGVVAGVAALPLTVTVAAAVACLFPGALSIALVRGAEAVVRNSVYRAGYELLYTPLSPAAKRPLKAWIDVGTDRVGTALGSGVVLVAVALWPSEAWRVLVGAAAVLGGIGAYAALRLRAAYVATLAEGLREGTLELSSPELADARSLGTLTATAGIDRQTLLREIERLHQAGIAAAREAPSASPPVASDAVDVITELTSGTPERVKRALGAEWSCASLLVAPAIDLLEDARVAGEARAFLQRHAASTPGQLLDAMLDPGRALAVRRRLASILAAGASQRCADALVGGLASDRLEVRLSCARALFDMTAGEDAPQVAEEAVYAAARAEAAADDASASWLLADEDPSAKSARRGDRRLEYVFRILSLVLDREPLALAWKALRTGDRRLQGTALEYLENVLPRDLRDPLFAHLPVTSARSSSRRSRREATDDLLESRTTIERELGPVEADAEPE